MADNDPTVTTEPAIDPNAPALTPAVDADAEPAKVEAPKPHIPEGVISTITGLRGKNRDLEDRLTKAEQRAADAQALADRLAQGDKVPPAPQATLRPAQGDQDAELNARAERLVYMREAQQIGTKLVQQFGQQRLADTQNLLAATTSDNGDAIIQAALAVDKDNAHALLNELSQNPERLIALSNMDPARRIAELTRMSIAASATAAASKNGAADPAAKPAASAKGVSKVPAPAPPIDPAASKVTDWRDDKASDEEFSKGWDKHLGERMAARRS